MSSSLRTGRRSPAPPARTSTRPHPPARPRRRGCARGARGVAVCVALGLATSLAPVGGVDAVPVRRLADVQADVERLRHEAEVAAERFNELREQIRGQQVLLAAVADRVALQRSAIASTRRLLGRLGVEAYRRGTLATVAVALGQDPESLVAHSGLLVSLADQKRGLLARLRAQEAGLTESLRQARERRARLLALSQRQAEAKAEVERRLGEAEALLAALQEDQRRELERATRAAERDQALAAEPERQRQPGRRRGARDDDRDRGERSGGDAGDDGEQEPPDPGDGSGSDLTCGSVGVTADARAARAIRFACAQLGEPYRWGAEGPSAWDCSGLTMKAWAKAGVHLPHSSRMQYGAGRRVGRSELRPGDLVFFYNPISHVGLYLGGGRMIHAPHSGDVVRIAPLHRGFVGGVRL